VQLDVLIIRRCLNNPISSININSSRSNVGSDVMGDWMNSMKAFHEGIPWLP